MKISGENEAHKYRQGYRLIDGDFMACQPLLGHFEYGRFF